MTLAVFHGGESGLLLYGQEETDYPDRSATSYGALPSAAMAVGGIFNVPDYVRDEANTKKYGAGSRKPLGKIKGQRKTEVTADISVCTATLLQLCLQGNVGTGIAEHDLADLCLYVGVNDDLGDGFGDYIRYAKCNTLGLNFNEDGEIVANANFWGLGRQSAGTALEVTHSTLAGLGNPLSWSSIQTFTIGGADYRDYIASIQLNYSNNLTRDGQRYDGGQNSVMARCPYRITPHRRTVGGTLTFRANTPASLIDAAANSDDWGGIVIGCNNAGVGGTTIFNTTVSGCTLSRKQMRGGDPSQPLMFVLPFEADDLAFATS